MIKQSFCSNEGTKTQIFDISTHIRSLIVRVCVYKNGQPKEIGTTAKHGACRERRTREYGTLTSIPCRSLRKVSTKIARPTKRSWFPKTGPKWKYDTINSREERADGSQTCTWTTHTHRQHYNSSHLNSCVNEWERVWTGSKHSVFTLRLTKL